MKVLHTGGTLNLGIKQFKRDNPNASYVEITNYKDSAWTSTQRSTATRQEAFDNFIKNHKKDGKSALNSLKHAVSKSQK